MNLLTCAGPRAGKGIGVIVPNLMTYAGSAVVIDPKGENATLTARYRRDVLGQKVVVLDPFHVAKLPPGFRGRYNPLAALDETDPYAVSDALGLANGIVIPNPQADEPFWDQSSMAFVQAVILHVLHEYPREARTLMKVRQLTNIGDWDLYLAFLRAMREGPDGDAHYPDNPAKAFELFLGEMADSDAAGGIIREEAAKISGMGDTTRGNVLGNLRTHLDFLKEPMLHECLSDHPDPERTFILPDFRRQDRHTTVYLCLPVDMMQSLGRWQRLIVHQIVTHIERTGGDFDKTRDRPVLMMMDEFAQLGAMPSIVNTLTYAPGHGLRIWLIIQDLNQLKTNYPREWETILGACGIKQFFGINDNTTAKYVSDMMGDEEIEVPQINMTVNASETAGRSRSETRSEGTSQSLGETWSQSESTSLSHTNGRAVTETHSTNHSITSGTNAGWNTGASSSAGWSSGSSVGASAHGPRNGLPSGQSKSVGGTYGNNVSNSQSVGRSGGISRSVQNGSGFSRAISTNSSTTRGTSQSVSRGGSRTEGTSQTHSVGETINNSETAGKSFGLTINRQTRRLFRQEEVPLAFTRENLMVLTHIRDQGGMLLFRTPHFADPYLRHLKEKESDDER